MTRLVAPKGTRVAARSTELGNRNHLDCPTCGGHLQYTKDSRLTMMADGTTKAIRRRRVCSDCGARHATIETLAATYYTPMVDALDELIERLEALRDKHDQGDDNGT
jgi:hypothetical protein